ncbi:MAG TPA: glutamate--tRNA ligase [Pyrinomonadaceae bacterium]|nr:glutamate--tRNA ligase [Pyrinomonadaceae bacterium]
MSIRVRFAPSPTGYLHIGAARTALFNWLYARSRGGKFLLRVEDTDLQRSTEESTRSILDGLSWLGLADYDEEIVFQSHNADAHRAAALRLVAEGKAYRDFTPKQERSDPNIKQDIAARARAAGDTVDQRSNPFRELSQEESEARAAAGEPFAVRLKVAREGRSRFEDAVYGTQERDYSEIEDLVLLRSEGLQPLYNLSVVVDDISMSVTHVIRGQDHLTNTHKQILIYEALGAPVPTFAHLPLILAPGGKKLSKRTHGEIVSLTTYRDAGFIPAAVCNFLALLGWSPSGEQLAASLTSGNEAVEVDPRVGELMTVSELIENFSLERIHRNPATFNFDANNPKRWTDDKLLWMNAEYLRNVLSLEELLPMVKAEMEAAGLWREEYEAERREWFERTIDLIRQRFYTLKDFTGQGRAYFADDFEYDASAVAKNLKKEPRLRELLPALAERIERVEPFDLASTEAALRAFAEETGVKAGLLINASRTALTGQSVGPSMFDVFVAVGRERAAHRLREAARLV